MTGTIKTLKEKGFGFISANAAAGRDIFFHISELLGVRFEELSVGDTVNFDLTQSEKGPKAVAVSRS